MEDNMKDNRIVSRLETKTKNKFLKILDKQGLSVQLVMEKYAQKVVREGTVNLSDWY